MRIRLDKGAVLYRPSHCDIWHLELTSSGQRRRFTLKTSSKDDALVLARQLVQEQLAQSWGIAIPRDADYDEFLKAYRAHAEAHNTPETVRLNLANLARMHEFVKRALGVDRELRLSDFSPKLIDSYKAARRAAGIAAPTINRELGTLSIFFSVAKRQNLVRTNPVELVQSLPIVRNRIPQTLAPEQISALLREAARPVPFHGRGGQGQGRSRPRLTPITDMVLFALNTGARLGEVLYLEWKDVDLRTGLISFRCKPEHQIKDREERQLRGNDAVLSMLRRRRLAAGTIRWVFPSASGGVLSRANALRELKLIASRAGVPSANFQMMRRTFLTACAASGMPSFVLRLLAGHSSVRTTERHVSRRKHERV